MSGQRVLATAGLMDVRPWGFKFHDAGSNRVDGWMQEEDWEQRIKYEDWFPLALYISI